MSSTRNSDLWVLIQWGSGDRSVVNTKTVISPTNEIKVGIVVIADKGNGAHEAATIIGFSRDRQILEKQIMAKCKEENEAGPSKEDEPEDFSASGSSWAPSDAELSSDDGAVERKKQKLQSFSQRSYSNKRGRVIKPSHRAEAINVLLNKSRKRQLEDPKREKSMTNIADKKSLPDSTRKNSPIPNPKSDIVSVNIKDIMEMKQCFQQLFTIIDQMKQSAMEKSQINDTINNLAKRIVREDININNTMNGNDDENHSVASERSEGFNRSDDNVLITNKYGNQKNNKKVLEDKDKNEDENLPEWIPIGTGKTLIHKDKYKAINWKSYTYATRTMLLAVFPRRILATHSLTGKRSPAFQNKSPKMCLDPKIVSDVIIEITQRFKVRENLVRTAITTKCADEHKMFKTREQRQSMQGKSMENDDNDDFNSRTFWSK